jgi:hypothetical protein
MDLASRLRLQVAGKSGLGFLEFRRRVGVVMDLPFALAQTERLYHAHVIKSPMMLSPAWRSTFIGAALVSQYLHRWSKALTETK